MPVGGGGASDKKSAEKTGSPKDQEPGDEPKVSDQESGATQEKKEEGGVGGGSDEGVLGEGEPGMLSDGQKMAGQEELTEMAGAEAGEMDVSEPGDSRESGGEVRNVPEGAEPSRGSMDCPEGGDKVEQMSGHTERVEGEGQEVMDDDGEEDDTAEFVLSEGDVRRIVNILEKLKNALEKAKHTTVSNTLP